MEKENKNNLIELIESLFFFIVIIYLILYEIFIKRMIINRVFYNFYLKIVMHKKNQIKNNFIIKRIIKEIDINKKEYILERKDNVFYRYNFIKENYNNSELQKSDLFVMNKIINKKKLKKEDCSNWGYIKIKENEIGINTIEYYLKRTNFLYKSFNKKEKNIYEIYDLKYEYKELLEIVYFLFKNDILIDFEFDMSYMNKIDNFKFEKIKFSKNEIDFFHNGEKVLVNFEFMKDIYDIKIDEEKIIILDGKKLPLCDFFVYLSEKEINKQESLRRKNCYINKKYINPCDLCINRMKNKLENGCKKCEPKITL